MIVLLVLCNIAVSVISLEYCWLNCRNTKHTMCRYPEGGGTHCRGYRRGLVKGEKLLILTLHNLLRQRVATGQEEKGHQPPAANMLELSWDEELEMIAQRWADQCYDQNHDQCRITLDSTRVGQNIATGWMKGYDINRRFQLYEWIMEWYNEVGSFSPKGVSNFRGGAGHYTQMVWATTTHVGCGLVDGTDHQGVYKFKLVCNYKPAGNILSLVVYQQGGPCSACPLGTICSSSYPGLCKSWNTFRPPGRSPQKKLLLHGSTKV